MCQKFKAVPLAGSRCSHKGEAVQVGDYVIHTGGTMYMTSSDLDRFDVLLPLTGCKELDFGKTYQFVGAPEDADIETRRKQPSGITPLSPGRHYTILAAPLVDFGGLPENWKEFLQEQVIPLLASGKTVLGFCIGSHGRTGTLVASLIALLEPDVADPVAEARRRHCHHAVETRAQAAGIFALRGQDLPEHYQTAGFVR